MRRNAIIILSGSQVIGVFTNLSKFLQIVEKRNLSSYATISLYIRHGFSFHIGACTIAGQAYEGVSLRKVSLNKIAR